MPTDSSAQIRLHKFVCTDLSAQICLPAEKPAKISQLSPLPQLSAALKRQAYQLGFDLCRIVPVEEALHADFFQRWLALGRAGEMEYLTRHLSKRRAPALLAEDGPAFRSLIVLGVDYHRFDLPPDVLGDPSRGVIARYAWGDDYHEIIRPLLYELDRFIRSRTQRTALGKGLVDTGPVLERDWAQRAGLGFTGKNCCTIHPRRGSWLFLATLLVPEELAYDPLPHPVDAPDVAAVDVAAGLTPGGQYGSWQLPVSGPAAEPATETATGPQPPAPLATCGQCTRCLDACPTDAFVGPFHLDPLRCISYWTIESRQPIPRHLRRQFGNRIFGCDICQEVCPWNQRLPTRTPLLEGLRAQQARTAPPLLEGFQPDTPYWLEQEAFSQRWRRSPLKRAKRDGMLRNVCVALGNWAAPSAVDALAAALADPSALARGHAAWALGQILRRGAAPQALALLQAAAAAEPDGWAREEIHLALAG